MDESTRSKSGEDLEDLLKQINSLEVVVHRLVRDMRKYTQSLEGMDKEERKCMVHLERSASKLGNSSLHKSLQNSKESLPKLDKATQHLKSVCQDQVEAPLKEYLRILSQCHAGLAKRQAAHQELGKVSLRWKKIEGEGRFSVTTAKLSQTMIELSEAQNLLSRLEAKVCRDVEVVVCQSGDVFEALLLTFSIAQMQHDRCTHSLLQSVVGSGSQIRPHQISEASLEAQMTALTHQLESLSIVKG